MGIKYSFVDNEIYGTEDVNDIVGCLTGAGVAPFLSKDSYSASDLNSLTEALVAEGTSLDGCKCTIENANTADMQVNVAQGIVFFESGVRLIVDGDGYLLAVQPNTAGYVCAHYSSALQRADIVFVSELPTDGEYVLLAEVSADGKVVDRRIYAKSKIATMGRNVLWERPFEAITPPMQLSETDSFNKTRYALATIPDVDLSKYKYALLTCPQSPASVASLYDIENNRYLFTICDGDIIRTTGLFATHNYSAHYYFEMLNNKFYIVVVCEKSFLSNITGDFSGYSIVLM